MLVLLGPQLRRQPEAGSASAWEDRREGTRIKDEVHRPERSRRTLVESGGGSGIGGTESIPEGLPQSPGKNPQWLRGKRSKQVKAVIYSGKVDVLCKKVSVTMIRCVSSRTLS